MEASGKKAKVRQKGVWCIDNGTGARSEGWCWVARGVSRDFGRERRA